jgi:uncharacterized membrane protein
MDIAPIVLILVSIAFDVVAYFGDDAPLQTLGASALFAASVGYWVTFIAGFRAQKRGRRVSSQRHLLVGSALACVLAMLLLWRLSFGTVVVSTFDGGYPILVAIALLLATYKAWLSPGR